MTADPAAAPALTSAVTAAVTAAAGPAAVPAPALVREWLAPFPLDVSLTLSVHRRGGGDPAYRTDASGAVWRTSLTPDGPGTLRVRSRRAAVTGPAVTGGPAVSRAWS